MGEFKPEDELSADPSDRRSGRSRKSDAFDKEPQFNVDDIDHIDDIDDRRMSTSKYDVEDKDMYDDEESMAAEPRSQREHRKNYRPKTPATRQYLMIGMGVLVLLLLIFGIGSALKAPSPVEQQSNSPSSEKSVDLAMQDMGASGEKNTLNPSENLSLPSTPSQEPAPGYTQNEPNTGLMSPQAQGEQTSFSSTLPTQSATIASVATKKPVMTEPKSERKKMTIESAPKPVVKHQDRVETAPTAPIVKHAEPTHVVSAPVKAPISASKPASKTSAASSTTSTSVVSGDIRMLKSAPSSSYTLQLSSSSSSANLNAWAKKENLKNYAVYQTTRNGKPWYVLVTGVYPTKAEAERAVSNLPAGVRDNKPWTKPIHQVQSEIK